MAFQLTAGLWYFAMMVQALPEWKKVLVAFYLFAFSLSLIEKKTLFVHSLWGVCLYLLQLLLPPCGLNGKVDYSFV